jgi:hypothetical protein
MNYSASLLIVCAQLSVYSHAMSNKLIPINTNPYTAVINSHKIIALYKKLIHDVELTEGKVKIIFPQHQKLIIEKTTAQQFDFFRGSLDFESHKRIIRIPDNAPDSVTKHNVEYIMTQDCHFIPKENVVDVYTAADFLGAKEKLLYPIAEAYVSTHNESDYGPEYEKIKKHLGIKHFFVKNKLATATLIKKNQLRLFGDSYARYEQIHSLDDLDYFTKLLSKKTRQSIHKISLRSHKISNFNLKKILSIFPHLKELDLSLNKMKTVTMDNIRYLPDGFSLNLSWNPITAIQSTKIKRYPANCAIFLSGPYDKSDYQELLKINDYLSPENKYFRLSCIFSAISWTHNAIMLLTRCLFYKNYIDARLHNTLLTHTGYSTYSFLFGAGYFLIKSILTQNSNKLIII